MKAPLLILLRSVRYFLNTIGNVYKSKLRIAKLMKKEKRSLDEKIKPVEIRRNESILNRLVTNEEEISLEGQILRNRRMNVSHTHFHINRSLSSVNIYPKTIASFDDQKMILAILKNPYGLYKNEWHNHYHTIWNQFDLSISFRRIQCFKPRHIYRHLKQYLCGKTFLSKKDQIIVDQTMTWSSFIKQISPSWQFW